MGWLSRLTGSSQKEIPSDIWKKCSRCSEVIINKELTKHLFLCPKCDHHLRMPVWDRIALLTDDNSFVEMDSTMESIDPLNFVDTQPYISRLKKSIETTDSYEAVICGEAKIDGRDFMLGVMNFDFMGGSMGSVVGEKIVRMMERGLKKRAPVVTVSASGGARMQEGILSLMQMAKTSQAAACLSEARIPFFSLLTDPTTGGVSASFAMLADINISEPEALIGFAGPRVIEQTIRQKLPEGFQRAKFLLEHGMVDMIVHRRQLKNTISKLLSLLLD
ncbi:MAG: acetyl-CoA carboxylase carboxyltransferase subunit beta [Candidatus Riflebacteria bacterium]|nr:acetyl-CoA carboxylase carboxyltransferase subunit beta [Candidatus Riflebacteria bacterium]